MHDKQPLLKRFTSNDRGAMTTLFSFTFLAAAGMAGLAVDYGRAVRAQHKLQSVVDQSAIAAASLPATANTNRIAQATKFFASNVAGSELSGIAPVIEASNAGVTVTASYEYPTTLMKLLHVETIAIRATTTARSQIQNGGVACLIALNPSTDDGLHLQGINKLSSENCWAWVNSTSPQAINAVGASTGKAQGFCSAGGVLGGEHFFPAPYTGCDPIDDPFANLVIPVGGACTASNRQYSNGTYTASPGVYCGGIDIKPQAHVTFQPGIYFIRNGKFEVQAQATAAGTGVVFVFEGQNAELIVRGGGHVDLKAPGASATNVGGLNGMLLVQSRDTTEPGRTTVIQGGGSVKMEGVLYMPTWRVDIGGNGDVNQSSKYFTMVADSFYMEGNGKLYVKSDAGGAGLPDLMPKIKNGPLLLE